MEPVESLIELAPSAIAQVRRLYAASEAVGEAALRLLAVPGEGHCVAYELDLASPARADDKVFGREGVVVRVDPVSALYLVPLIIDWAPSEDGGAFVVRLTGQGAR